MVHPGRTALYRLFDAEERLLYIGITHNLKERFYQHSTTRPWWSSVANQRIEWLDTRVEAEASERAAIRSERPIWNVKLSLDWGMSSEVEALFTEYRLALEETRMLLPLVKKAAPDLMRDGAVATTGFRGSEPDPRTMYWIYAVMACEACAELYAAGHPEWGRQT